MRYTLFILVALIPVLVASSAQAKTRSCDAVVSVKLEGQVQMNPSAKRGAVLANRARRKARRSLTGCYDAARTRWNENVGAECKGVSGWDTSFRSLARQAINKTYPYVDCTHAFIVTIGIKVTGGRYCSIEYSHRYRVNGDGKRSERPCL